MKQPFKPRSTPTRLRVDGSALQPSPERPSFFGSAKGTVLHYDRPFDPINGDYDVNRD